MPKQPQTPCPTCGKVLSRQAMKRHRGRQPCVEQYTKNTMREQYALPEGHRVVGWSADRPLFAVATEAGLYPEDSPIRYAMIMGENDTEPRMRLIAPTWLCIVGDVLGQIDQTRIDLDRRRKQTRLGAAKMQSAADDLVMVKRVLDSAVTDAATVLREATVEQQTGFCVALAFMGEAGDGKRAAVNLLGTTQAHYDAIRAERTARQVAVLNALRSEASRALGGV